MRKKCIWIRIFIDITSTIADQIIESLLLIILDLLSIIGISFSFTSYSLNYVYTCLGNLLHIKQIQDTRRSSAAKAISTGTG